MLAINHNRSVSLDRLVDAVWESAPPATAREQVQNCVSLMRRNLRTTPADLIIERNRIGYQLRGDDFETDAHCFEREVRAADELLTEGRLADAAGRLQQGLAHWSGPALDGLNARELRAHAIRLDELRLAAMERLATTNLRLGRHDRAIAELRALIEIEPLRENISILLMDALADSGRSIESLTVYRVYRDRLRTELGVEPGPVAKARERQLLQSLNPPAPIAVENRVGPTRLAAPATQHRHLDRAEVNLDRKISSHLETAYAHIRAAFELLGAGPPGYIELPGLTPPHAEQRKTTPPTYHRRVGP
ncbi:AfsR/SARP family transcriptional regulator [Micromonospora coriariae]|nr:BTAD domain-containing putative transcriptional regulator [Micromonospora coriariae]